MKEVAQWGTSYFVLVSKYHSADQIKENELGATSVRESAEWISWLKIGAVAGPCDYGDEPAGSFSTEFER
jgi:hypothetical protein